MRMRNWLYISLFLELQFCSAFVLSKNIPHLSGVTAGRRGRDHQDLSSEMKLSSSASNDQRQLSRDIPKVETGVLSLLEKYPTADGRGVKVAVLDTGCDLGAAGLQRTSDGKPKYLDFIDCTGDGDIDMTKIVEIKSPGEGVVGLSGRTLLLGEWANQVKELRMGAVRLYHLLPRSVERRLKVERKEKFAATHRDLISKTQRSLDELRKACDEEKDDEKKSESKKEVKELELLLEQLKEAMESFDNDPGPLMDAVMYNDTDGSWKAVVDLDASGNLTQSTPMAPFGHEGQTGELGFGSAVTFCVQVYDEGKILSIVTDAGSHGTHVAGIVAANFGREQQSTDESDDGEGKTYLNGVAPGAQILACKIGDGRLGSTETGTGLVRALIACKKYGCDLINLSYGEPSWQPDSGRVAQTFTDAVYKWGMTVFTSAGNDGPALSSLGSPGCLTAPITVGAFVSTDMMRDQYSTLPPTGEEEPLEGASYYFSSRGPTPDGAMPDLCAPGGAISPIPRHALQGKAQYHGTSMSSPNACGVAACVLSALKENGIEKCNPTELKRGLVNSCTQVDVLDPFAQGAGLISAVGAVDYIIKNHGKDGQDLPIKVSIPSRNNARGIYVRDALELEGPMTFSVLVQPSFDQAFERTPDEMKMLLSLELELQFKPSDDWVVCPEKMTLMSAKERNGQSFSIRLKTQDLSAGVHYATVDAIDSSDPGRGAIFQVPITVIVPHSKFLTPTSPKLVLNDAESISINESNVDFSTTYKLLPGAPNRRFLSVPPTAEWATLKVRGVSSDLSATSPKRVMLHAIPYVRGDVPNTSVQLKKLIGITEGIEKKFSMRVAGGSTLELCLQLMWLANPSITSVDVDVEFHSLNIRPPNLVSTQPVIIGSATEFARLGASAMLRSEQVNPTATLKTVQRTIRPVESKIVSGSIERDLLPPSDAEVKASQGGTDPVGTQIYNMYLQYKFKVAGDKPIAAVPSVPSLFQQLYDSPLDSQLWVLKDSNSQILGYGSSMHQASSVSLAKGDYNITYLLRHPDRYVLEQMKDTSFQISFTLPDPLSCNVYSELDKASTPAVTGDGRKSLGSMLLKQGAQKDLYVARPTGDLPAWVTPGDTISGVFVLDKNNQAPTSMKLVYAVPPKATTKKSDDDEKSDDDDEDSLEDTVFLSKVKFLSKLQSKKDNAYGDLAAKLQEERPDSIPLLLELLSFAKKAPLPKSETDENKWRAQEIEKVKNSMMKANGGPIDEAVLAQYFGLKPPDKSELQEDKEAKKIKKEMDEQKKCLQAALLARASILGKTIAEDEVEDFDSAVKDLKKWVGGITDLADDDDKVSLTILLARHASLCQNKKATAMSILIKGRKDLKVGAYKEITNELIELYKSFGGMEHLIDHANNDIFNRFPVAKQDV